MINRFAAIPKSLVQNRILQHILFWLCSFSVLVQFFALENQITDIDIVYTLLFHISLVFGVYVNTAVLIRFLLKKEKYALYLISVFCLWYFVALMNQFTFEKLSDWIVPDYLFISSYSFEDLLKFSFVYLALSTLLKMSKFGFYALEAQKALEVVKREQAELELNVLKSNINPHFLFNNLNSLYALSRKHAKETPEYILKLSDLMRYMIYETKGRTVSLENEINYISNYLDLQKLRCNSDININYTIQGEVGSQQIVPFLFIPFIENSFKHGGANQSNSNLIDLQICVEEKNISMILTNTIADKKNRNIGKVGGFGIDNVKKRLNSHYPERHELTLAVRQDQFKVKLKLDLNE
ncbi:sensor histidine kinase [Labilibaculum sp.]|uniref:sensor histidine kinase n=1 Tax=Labilibaculum sp. TaxID=2060723 RepID=UPI003566A99E